MGEELEGVLEGEELLPASGDALEDLVQRVLAGEVEAFGELMARTEARVLGVAWRLLRDRELARDAAQEAYLRMYRGLGSFRPGEGFQPWMYRVAVNACLDLRARQRPAEAAPELLETLPAELPSAEESVLRAQRRALVRQGLGTLTDAERAALVLRDLEGLNSSEAGRILGLRACTVRSQAASARSKLAAFCRRLSRRSPGGLP
jgi:RNA polymerase sigma-70 factor (ECF subfamily)